MFVSNNKTAGIITIGDLPQMAKVEIQDFSGNIIRGVNAITPLITIDSENFRKGQYKIVARSRGNIVSLVVSV